MVSENVSSSSFFSITCIIPTLSKAQGIVGYSEILSINAR